MTYANPAPRPRRSVLYMPGANARALQKAKVLAADAVIFDLEDAVAPEAKSDARALVTDAVSGGGYDPREVIIRINALNTEWGEADLKAAVKAGPDAILAPKVEKASDIALLDDAMTKAGAHTDIALWVMIETPLAILNLKEIAAATETSRLSTFVMGTNDLAKDMRAEQTPFREPFLPALALSVTAARAFGLTVIDGVHNDIQDVGGFDAVCRQGRALGFDGKTLIHPSQIETCNAVFAPAEDDVAQARDVIAAFADPDNSGKGVLKVNGKMTELLHLEAAKRLVAVADRIAAFEKEMAQGD